MKSFFAVCRRYLKAIISPVFVTHEHYNVFNAVNRNSFYNVTNAGDYNN